MKARPKSGLLFAMIDIEPEFEEELNRWYEDEHLPERLARENFSDARRFLAAQGDPRYLVTYEVDDPDGTVA